jgi:hypothetical protein
MLKQYITSRTVWFQGGYLYCKFCSQANEQ